jgi:hypothetical protein
VCLQQPLINHFSSLEAKYDHRRPTAVPYITLKIIVLTIQIICLEDGTDRMFRNVGQYKPDAGETPKS